MESRGRKQTVGRLIFSGILTLKGWCEVTSLAAIGHRGQRSLVYLWLRGFLTCLLAKTRRTASLSSSSASILISSSLASLTRSRSLLSTTKMSPKDSPAGVSQTFRLFRREESSVSISSTHPACFESSVSRGDESCPAHPHPTQ